MAYIVEMMTGSMKCYRCGAYVRREISPHEDIKVQSLFVSAFTKEHAKCSQLPCVNQEDEKFASALQ